MFKSKPKFDVNTLKLNIKLAIERINIVKRKKVELSKRTRKNVADLISKQEITSATIKTEQLIRDDNLIEAMDVVKNYLEILHSRSGLIQTQQNIDESLTIAVMSMIWVDPRLSCDIPELSIISKQFLSKYGKQFYDTAISNSLQLVFPHLVSLLSVEPPSDCLIDQYMKAIAEAHHVQFTSTYVDKNEHLVYYL
uniref:IST1 homolog n=1 Tax=Henneguya salminicola TaxID=69463 RepID=A0A6G3MEH4_HENSL